ncbi:MAG: hypothetical protein JWQ88_775 [Rhodoferax sp.]|nr:hypothetical protein [Rhodoferax sp.]
MNADASPQFASAGRRRPLPRPAFLPVWPARGAPWAEWREAFAFTGYGVGNYLLLNVVEDPAWLALAFC